LLHHASQIPKPDITPAFPPHILGRFIAARLYQADITGRPADDILADAKKYHAGIKASREDSPFSFPDFELILCEALLLTGHYEDGSEYIWHGKNFLSESGLDKNSSFDLWEDFASFHKEGDPRKKKDYAEKQELNYSFSKKYSAIIKLLSGLNTKRIKVSDKQQLSELIKETGYKKLLSLPVY
jgi:hypothetical protein